MVKAHFLRLWRNMKKPINQTAVKGRKKSRHTRISPLTLLPRHNEVLCSTRYHSVCSRYMYDKKSASGFYVLLYYAPLTNNILNDGVSCKWMEHLDRLILHVFFHRFSHDLTKTTLWCSRRLQKSFQLTTTLFFLFGVCA